MIVNVIILTAAIAAAMVGTRFYVRWFVERQIAGYQNDLTQKHCQEVDNLYRQTRGWRHDFKNHLQTMQAYLELGQLEPLEHYIRELTEDYNRMDMVLRTGNTMVDAILNSKLSLIQERHIAVDAAAAVPGDISISGIDLSVLIGNLLDNAMEACLELSEEKERFIRIYIDIVKKQLYISVTNSMRGKAVRTGEGFLSRKQGSHGFGLFRIDSIVAKYHGYLNRQSENGVFATEVMLPLLF